MKLLRLIFSIAVLFLIANFIFPTPGKTYSGILWGIIYGALHGILLIPNWITSLFDHSRLIKASLYNDWYNFSWWLAAIGSVLNFIENFFSLLKRTT